MYEVRRVYDIFHGLMGQASLFQIEVKVTVTIMNDFSRGFSKDQFLSIQYEISSSR